MGCLHTCNYESLWLGSSFRSSLALPQHQNYPNVYSDSTCFCPLSFASPNDALCPWNWSGPGSVTPGGSLSLCDMLVPQLCWDVCIPGGSHLSYRHKLLFSFKWENRQGHLPLRASLRHNSQAQGQSCSALAVHAKTVGWWAEGVVEMAYPSVLVS